MLTESEKARIDNWIKAQREYPRAFKCATQIICEHLSKGQPDKVQDLDTEETLIFGLRRTGETIDVKDAMRLDRAYQRLPIVLKKLLRMYYIEKRTPRHIERVLEVAPRTFYKHHEKAVRTLLEISASY